MVPELLSIRTDWVTFIAIYNAPVAVTEKIQDHRIRMQDALDDVRGRIGVGGEGLAPEPGTA